jgi:hypothetical protein
MTLIPSDAAQLLHADSRQDTVVVLTTTKREEMQTFSGEKGYEMNREGDPSPKPDVRLGRGEGC